MQATAATGVTSSDLRAPKLAVRAAAAWDYQKACGHMFAKQKRLSGPPARVRSPPRRPHPGGADQPQCTRGLYGFRIPLGFGFQIHACSA